jgi:hypothetical protein
MQARPKNIFGGDNGMKWYSVNDLNTNQAVFSLVFDNMQDKLKDVHDYHIMNILQLTTFCNMCVDKVYTGINEISKSDDFVKLFRAELIMFTYMHDTYEYGLKNVNAFLEIESERLKKGPLISKGLDDDFKEKFIKFLKDYQNWIIYSTPKFMKTRVKYLGVISLTPSREGSKFYEENSYEDPPNGMITISTSHFTQELENITYGISSEINYDDKIHLKFQCELPIDDFSKSKKPIIKASFTTQRREKKYWKKFYGDVRASVKPQPDLAFSILRNLSSTFYIGRYSSFSGNDCGKPLPMTVDNYKKNVEQLKKMGQLKVDI